LRWVEETLEGRYSHQGTAFLISPTLILTAAHNLVNKKGKPHSELYFFPGINGKLDNYPTEKEITLGEIKVCPKYRTDYRASTDFGIASLTRIVELDQYIEIGFNYP